MWRGAFMNWNTQYGQDILLKVIQSQCNPNQNLNSLLYKNWQADFKMCMEIQRHRLAKTVSKNSKVQITLSDYKITLKLQ